MDLINYLIPLSGAILTALFILISRKKPKKDRKGNHILRLPIQYPVFGFLVTSGSLGILVIGLQTAQPEEHMTIALFSLLLAALGVPLILMSTVYKLVITPEKLEQTSMLGNSKTIRWGEIKSINFSKISLELKIKSNAEQIKAHHHLVGFDILISELESRTGFSQKEMGFRNNM